MYQNLNSILNKIEDNSSKKSYGDLYFAIIICLIVAHSSYKQYRYLLAINIEILVSRKRNIDSDDYIIHNLSKDQFLFISILRPNLYARYLLNVLRSLDFVSFLNFISYILNVKIL